MNMNVLQGKKESQEGVLLLLLLLDINQRLKKEKRKYTFYSATVSITAMPYTIT
jgi:hypothetical protein